MGSHDALQPLIELWLSGNPFLIPFILYSIGSYTHEFLPIVSRGISDGMFEHVLIRSTSHSRDPH